MESINLQQHHSSAKRNSPLIMDPMHGIMDERHEKKSAQTQKKSFQRAIIDEIYVSKTEKSCRNRLFTTSYR